MKNPILKKSLLYLFILFFLGLLFFFAYLQLTKKPKTYFILENVEASNMPSDIILHNYDEYKILMDKYDVNMILTKENFKSKYYVASFQEYDSCREKERTIKNVEINENIKITYMIDNKCGWCKEKVLLYLIEIEKIASDLPISYDYIYKNNLECEL